MNNRFQFSFTDVERKLLKKVKGLKPKNKYTLKEIECLIECIQLNWHSPTTVTILCDDTEEGITYAYDNIHIVPFSMKGKEILLMPEIEKQTLNVEEIKDPNRLIFDINSQYQSESDVTNKKEKINKKQKGKKGFSMPSISLPFGKREHIEVHEEEEEDFEIEDVADPRDFPTQQIDAVKIEDKEEEDIDFENFEDEENEEDLNSSLPVETIASSHKSLEALKNYSSTSQEHFQQQITQKKHETVKFEDYDKYMDLGEEIDNIISEMNNKLKPENLMKFVGVSSTGITNTKIEEYRINYVKQCLSEVKFQALRDHYSVSTNQIKEDVIDRLDEAFEKVMLNNYEDKAKAEYSKELNAIENETKEKIEMFEKEQYEISEEKANKLKAKQEMELQAFQNKQQAEFELFIATENERIRNIIETRKEDLTTEKDYKYEEILDNAMYSIKSRYSRELLEGKRKLKQYVNSQIKIANQDIWNKAQQYIVEIQENISNNIPKWSQEIHEFNALEEQAHQRNLREEEMRLKRERNEIAKLQAQTNLDRQKKLEQDLEMLKIQYEKERSKCELLQMKLSLNENQSMNIPNMTNEKPRQGKRFLSIF
ncbi:hypothetical protein ACWO4B_003238 [Clostridium sporogenes]